MRKVYRTELEHAISTLKEHFHLLAFCVKGWNKVETHVHGIATFKAEKNPRQLTLI